MSEYEIFQKYITVVKQNYIEAIASYHTYNTIREIIAPNIIGQEKAEENAKTLNRYNSFFLTTINSLYNNFLIHLSKILDGHKDDPISIQLLIKYAKNHKDKFTIEEFKKSNKNNNILDKLIERYTWLTDEDIEKVDQKFKECDTERKTVKDIRDKFLTHEDRVKPKIYIQENDIKKLFNFIKETLDLFSSKTNGSFIIYKKIEDDCERDARDIVEHLKVFDKNRRKEWMEKYNIPSR